MNPETEGLLPEKIVLAVSTDGARTWSSRQVMDTSPHRAPSPCANHVLRLANGDLIQPYETHKEWHDPSARLALDQESSAYSTTTSSPSTTTG